MRQSPSFSSVYIILIALFVMFAPSAAMAEDVIASIAIEGNRYIETAAILTKVRSKVGEPLSKRQISRDVRRLFATGYFSDVFTEGESAADGLHLVFHVVENPVIASVEIEGNEELSDKKLKPLLDMKPGFILSPLVERKDTNTIRKKYLEKGYYQMDVDIQTTTLEDGRIDVVINVVEGEVTHIKEIRFIGNKAFTADELLNPLASRASDFGSWFSDKDVFNRDRFEADAQLIRQFYQEHGHLDARVESIRLMLTPNKDSFYLALSVFEGPAYTISGISLTGDVVPSKDAVMENVKLEVGDLYKVSTLRQAIEAITERVGDEGYAFANVTPLFQRNLKDNTLFITFDIEKGREVYIERVVISGHKKTKDNVIRREMRQHEGERYKASDVKRSKERLRRLQFLKDIRVSTPPVADPNKVNMNIDVEEGKSGSFTAGMTYSQLYGASLTGTVAEQNLFGEGYQTNVSGDIGGATTNYSASIVDPYFMSEDVTGSFSLNRTQTDLQTITDYKQDTSGWSAGLGFALSEFSRYAVKYSLTRTTLSDVNLATASAILKAQIGQFTTSEITQSISFDTRDRIIAATDGGIYSLVLGTAGLGGDFNFYEVTTSATDYTPLSDFWTLRTSATAGKIAGIGDSSMPIYRRYSLGGAGSLRGFGYYGVTLREPGTLDVLGGTYKATSSLDLIFPLPYMAQAGFRGAFFVEAGTVWGDAGVVTESFSLSKVRASYGFGIEWMSPVGAISMIWGQVLRSQPDDEKRGFEFSIGRGF
ncbi:MAG: outer membrane protein assembly factor BamA [Zetaproteobacteria bacterium CG2_30_46_52]|nr:MAG: outer membrane protein assembly factor BamA [Zetaproteobacteria bacterium CG2_30_46_52]